MTLFVWQHRKEFQDERIGEARSAGFWQMPCPPASLVDFLSIRRVKRSRSRPPKEF